MDQWHIDGCIQSRGIIVTSFRFSRVNLDNYLCCIIILISEFRFLGSLKRFVRNKARPEGSIAEAYVVKECLTFCSMYLRGIETHFNMDERNNDKADDDDITVFSQQVRTFGATQFISLPKEEQDMAHWYVLTNCEEMEPYFE